MGKFRAPSLRNAALTAPYLHDGSIATLEAVVALHANGGRVFDPGCTPATAAPTRTRDPLIDQTSTPRTRPTWWPSCAR